MKKLITIIRRLEPMDRINELSSASVPSWLLPPRKEKRGQQEWPQDDC